MPKEPEGRRGRKDEELWIRNYDRKQTIFDRLGISPQLLSLALFICLLTTLGLFFFTTLQNSEHLKSFEQAKIALADKDKRISQLEGQVASLKPKAESADTKDQQLQVLQGQIAKLNKQVDSYKNCKCKPGKT
jgi:uncharacterized protein HemX